MSETTEPQLTEAQVDEYEKRRYAAVRSYHSGDDVNWFLTVAIPALIRDWRAMKADLDFEKKWHGDHAEREAAVCPEDVPCDEYIRALEKQNTALRERLAEIERDREQILRNDFITRDRLSEAQGTLKALNTCPNKPVCGHCNKLLRHATGNL